MEDNIIRKIKQIDDAVSSASSNISGLKERLSTVECGESREVLKIRCSDLMEKLSSFSHTFQQLVDVLTDLEAIARDDNKK